MKARTRRIIRRAFTLVESLLAAVILAMTVSAMVMPYVAGAQNQSEHAKQAVAVTLAQDLLEEILSKPFSDPDGGAVRPGPDPGESTRETFDNQDDYDGYVEEVGEIRPFQQDVVDGDAASQLGRWAEVRYVRVAGQQPEDPECFVQITVVVTNQGREVIRLSRLSYANEPEDS